MGIEEEDTLLDNISSDDTSSSLDASSSDESNSSLDAISSEEYSTNDNELLSSDSFVVFGVTVSGSNIPMQLKSNNSNGMNRYPKGIFAYDIRPPLCDSIILLVVKGSCLFVVVLKQMVMGDYLFYRLVVV